MPGVFLTARWEHLIVANYAVEAGRLAPYLPAGVELDDWQGQHLVSVVGFRFLGTAVWGWRIPYHIDFEEVNLRFYVRRRMPQGWRRGVVFIHEFVPRRAIAWVARWIYREPYAVRPMRATVRSEEGRLHCRYDFGRDWIAATAEAQTEPLAEGSQAEFILEHYHGYNRHSARRTLEYGVEHPRWRTYRVLDYTLRCDAAAAYGPTWREPLAAPPVSVVMAEGSAVTVRRGCVVA